MEPGRAGAGSASGLGKRTGSNPDTAPQADATTSARQHPHSFTRWRGGGRYLSVYLCSRCGVPVKCVKVRHRLRLLCQPVRRRWHALVTSRSWWVAVLVYQVASEDAVSPAKRSIWQSVLGTGPFRPVTLGWYLAWLRWGIRGWSLGHCGDVVRFFDVGQGRRMVTGCVRGWSCL